MRRPRARADSAPCWTSRTSRPEACTWRGCSTNAVSARSQDDSSHRAAAHLRLHFVDVLRLRVPDLDADAGALDSSGKTPFLLFRNLIVGLVACIYIPEWA